MTQPQMDPVHEGSATPIKRQPVAGKSQHNPGASEGNDSEPTKIGRPRKPPVRFQDYLL